MTDSSWITITVGGVTAGAAAAAVTYTATLTTSKALAFGSSISMSALGEVAGYGASYFLGPAAGVTVRIVSNTAAKTAEETIKNSGYYAAAGAAAVAGALTALTVTIGTRAIEYSIEYGGKLSKEVAQQISEAYIKYKMSHVQFSDYTPVNELEDNDWVVISSHQPASKSENKCSDPDGTDGPEVSSPHHES